MFNFLSRRSFKFLEIDILIYRIINETLSPEAFYQVGFTGTLLLLKHTNEESYDVIELNNLNTSNTSFNELSHIFVAGETSYQIPDTKIINNTCELTFMFARLCLNQIIGANLSLLRYIFILRDCFSFEITKLLQKSRQ